MFPKSKQIRWLVDCDSFYASCEVFLNPKLKWLPVCIWWDIVIARSYEAKPYGIKVWTPIREAKKMLPDNAVYLKPRMLEYGKISKRLMEYLAEKCTEVEIFSIDEAFFEIGWYDKMYKMEYARMMPALKNAIRRDIGIPVSIGLAPTRLLAKMFADINKPYWECIALDDITIDRVLKTLPLAEVPFIWPQTQKKLVWKCTTAYDFKALDYADVKQMLGKNWTKIRCELNGINAMQLWYNDHPKWIWRTRSFNPHFTDKKEEVRARLLSNIEKAIEHLHDVKMSTKYLRLYFRTKDFSRFGIDTKLPYPTNDGLQLTKIARNLFEQISFDGTLYRTTGIFFSDLSVTGHVQESLFSYTHKPTLDSKKISDIIQKLNKKFGRGAVHVGTAKPEKEQKKDFIFMEV